MSDKEEIPLPKIETVRDPDFKVIFADGVAGDLNPERGLLTFFYDVPDLETNPQGIISINKLTRHLSIDIRLTPDKWTVIARWMMQHADYYEKWKDEQFKNKNK